MPAYWEIAAYWAYDMLSLCNSLGKLKIFSVTQNKLQHKCFFNFVKDFVLLDNILKVYQKSENMNKYLTVNLVFPTSVFGVGISF